MDFKEKQMQDELDEQKAKEAAKGHVCKHCKKSNSPFETLTVPTIIKCLMDAEEPTNALEPKSKYVLGRRYILTNMENYEIFLDQIAAATKRKHMDKKKVDSPSKTLPPKSEDESEDDADTKEEDDIQKNKKKRRKTGPKPRPESYQKRFPKVRKMTYFHYLGAGAGTSDGVGAGAINKMSN